MGSKKNRENNINKNNTQTKNITRKKSKQTKHKHKQYHTKKEVSRDLEKNWLGQAVNLQSNKLGF